MKYGLKTAFVVMHLELLFFLVGQGFMVWRIINTAAQILVSRTLHSQFGLDCSGGVDSSELKCGLSLVGK